MATTASPWETPHLDAAFHHTKNAVSDVYHHTDNVLSWTTWILSLCAKGVYYIEWMAALLIVIILIWVCRERWMRKVYEATCAKISVPDIRNKICCWCCSCGWLLMNVLFPFACPRFHPPFRLRLIAVKAKHLNLSLLNVASSEVDVHAVVNAGNNPHKSTSWQTYRPRGGRGGAALITAINHGDDTVRWNEPIDLIMNPGDTYIGIELFAKNALEKYPIGYTRISVDAIYKSPGICNDCACCDRYPCARWWHKRIRWAKYKWPFVIGAPRALDFRIKEDEVLDDPVWYCHNLPKLRKNAVPVDAARAAEITDKREAVILMQKDGMQLQNLQRGEDGRWFQEDIDVVAAAVSQTPEAIRFASQEMQADKYIQRLAAQLPRPMILELERHNKPAGRIWVYFVLHNIDGDDDIDRVFYNDDELLNEGLDAEERAYAQDYG